MYVHHLAFGRCVSEVRAVQEEKVQVCSRSVKQAVSLSEQVTVLASFCAGRLDQLPVLYGLPLD